MKILLELKYNGSGFAGYQVQPGKCTVQSAIQDAIESVYGERYPIKGCSRTDAGVHALQYFATFETERNIPLDKLPMALNASIDSRIAILSARIVNDDFHVRHDVEYKEYEYLIHASRISDPFLIDRAWHFPKTLCQDAVSLMRKAAEAFVGTHDFSGFMSAGSSVEDTVRTVKYLEIIEDGELIRIKIAADGFLYNMVRIIVGTLIEVATGKIDAGDLPDIISSCDRSRAGITAPPEGLYLRRVEFL